MEKDIRWEQRFANFNKALKKLTQAVELTRQSKADESKYGLNMEYIMDEIFKEGLIQRFEYTHELAWNVMKDYAAYQGNTSIGGSRDATREAFQLQLISNGSIWMDMIVSRNKSTHTYNENTANEIYEMILEVYYPAFLEFQKNMEALQNGG